MAGKIFCSRRSVRRQSNGYEKKEIADEKRAAKTHHYLKWMLDAAIAAAVLALIAVLWVIGFIPRWIEIIFR